MFETITVARLSTWTVFKLVGIGLTLGMTVTFMVAGVLSLFGLVRLTYLGIVLPDAVGLMLSPLIAVTLAAGFTLGLGSCIALGLWLYSWLRPITLVVKVADAPTQA
jgi:hypothetical protein